MEHITPLLQTLSWIFLIVYGAKKFSGQLIGLVAAIESRIKTGSSFKAGPVQLGEDLKVLAKLPSEGERQASDDKGHLFRDEFKGLKETSSFDPADSSAAVDSSWTAQRESIYAQNQKLFLTHVIIPSKERGQKYDIFIYLIRHKSKRFDDVEYAEFFLGKYWGNQIYKETLKDGLVGVKTAAFGSFLCTCRVKMTDGSFVLLHRYIDFEMGRVYD